MFFLGILYIPKSSFNKKQSENVWSSFYIFDYTMKTQIYEYGDFYFHFPHSWQLKTCKFILNILILNFALLAKICQLKKVW
jgi:hypothetical protein